MGILKTRGLEAKFELQNSVVHALRGIDLDVEEGEFFVLLGPSGCDKTTMLRSIAGLERPSAGEISIDNKEVVRTNTKLFVPPDQRPIAMVFQNYAIWPHMDVFENIAFPLRRGRTKLGEAAKKYPISRHAFELTESTPMVRFVITDSDEESGELFTIEMITVKGPGTGISPMYLERILGLFALRDIEEDVVLYEDYFGF